MSPKISIIVPVYKVEAYLHQCIDSIIAQTYTNLEIILVDDGSPDNCGKICDEYAEKDSRIIVIHKQNGGVSSARNDGLDIAIGKYISFIDSDDWIEADMYEMLYNNLVKYNADISCCSYYRAYTSGINEPVYNVDEVMCLNSEQAIVQSFTGGSIAASPWGKLFKKHIFDNIRYPVNISIGEDGVVIMKTFSKVSKITIHTIPKYFYRQRKSSAVNSTNKKFNSKMTDRIKASEYNMKFIQEKHPSIFEVGKARLLGSNTNALAKIMFCETFRQIPEYKTILTTLRKNFWFIMRSKHIARNDKIKAVALRINIMLFKWIYVLHFWLKRSKEKIMFE